jgi:muramoyltetrapeptide carboxypeptidase
MGIPGGETEFFANFVQTVYPMKRPPSLKKGDLVAIVAPARKITPDKVGTAVSLMEDWGLKVFEGKHLFSSFHQFAGTDEERAADMQMILDDRAIRAVFIVRGGYGLVHIIDRLDFNTFAANPKWLVGFSDTTVAHSHIHTNLAVETIHATMPVQLADPELSAETAETLRKALFGEPLTYTLNRLPLSREGSARGVLVGGNLSILYSMAGSRSDLDTKGKILFLEDLDEYLYHIDRMMWQLKRSGKLEALAGLIVGGLTAMRDNDVPFGKTAEEIIADAVKEYDYPVCFGFPAGHVPDNRALILGREALLKVGNEVVFEQIS